MGKNIDVLVVKNHSIHPFKKVEVMAFFKKNDTFRKIAEKELKNFVMVAYELKKQKAEAIKTSLAIDIEVVI